MTARIPKIVVIGSSFVDMSVQCESTPRPGQCVGGSGFSSNPSGAGANQAIQAALCKCKSSIISCVGNDVFGDKIRENLVKFGVNVDNLFVAEAKNTGIIVTLVGDIGDNIGCVSAGANTALSPEHIHSAAIEQEISGADCCIIDGSLNEDTAIAIIRTAELHRTKTVLHYTLSAKKAMEEIAQFPQEFFSVKFMVCDYHADSITENSTNLVHESKPIATDLVARGVENTIMRCGRRGCVAVDKESIKLIEPIQGENISICCGSDAFVGALGACVAVNDPLEKAVKFAMAAEEVACLRNPVQENLPRKEDILEMLMKRPD